MSNLTFRDVLAGLPPGVPPDSGGLLTAFLDWADRRGLVLYPAQETAVLELLEGKNVILNTPTGSGKSLVASVLHFQALARGRRSVYTCPIKALVNEKWMALCREFGPEQVGLSTGDATVNRDAPILCCTAEILANIALSQGRESDVRDVVMDEFHYYSDRERGAAWQIPLLTLPDTRFLLMSATLGETEFFERVLTGLNGLPSVTVKSKDRPVPLDFAYADTSLPETVARLATLGRAPVYVVHFTQAEAARNAQSFTSLDLATKEEKASLAASLAGFRFSSPYGPDLKRWLRQGIGLHHAGLLPKYRILVERLAQQGLLKVICGTDTLGVGVNVPIRSVLFSQLCKYGGDKTAILSARDFHQISGRAGRKGFDDIGFVVAQAPEHVVENLKLAAKAAQSGRKFVKRQPPEKGYVPWDESTFRRLIDAVPERLVSRFQVTHGMLLNVLARSGDGPANDGCRAMREIITHCHDSERDKAAHRKRAFRLFRTLVERGIVEIFRHPGPGRPKLRVNLDLQANFSMDQALSLFLLDALPLLDPEHPDYPLDLLTLVESILEDPDMVLRRQLDLLKTQRMAELKAQGVEYDERIRELETMEHPKPLREFVYGTFNAFAEKHPWLGEENIRPKSIAREMLEGYFTFSGYVKRYGLERSEGLLLRHLGGVYKVLANTVPAAFKSEAVREMELFFGALLRRVDSSLLEEWERLKNPEFQSADQPELRPPGADAALAAAPDITADPKVFVLTLRVRIFAFLAALSRRDYTGALESLCEGAEDGDAGQPGGICDSQGVTWNELRLQERLESYLAGHGMFRLDPEGRAARHTLAEFPPGSGSDREPLRVRQLLQDSQDKNDWALDFEVDLVASRTLGQPVLRRLAWVEAE